MMNRALSIRSRNKHGAEPSKHLFSMSSLRGTQQPDLSKKLYKLIKTENHAINAYETAGREGLSIATQLSDWGESTGDDAISEISDKLGVVLAEIAEQEEGFASGLEESRGVLKQIRNTEGSVQPSRDHKLKIADELAKLKYKEPSSIKIPGLEQELVRAEAQSLVAEAQLTNITRQKLREAYALHIDAILVRSEKQALLAKQAQRLIELLDDSPIVPGEAHPPFDKYEETKAVLNDAEAQLRDWQPSWKQLDTRAKTGADGMASLPTTPPRSATAHDHDDLYSEPSVLGASSNEHASGAQEVPTTGANGNEESVAEAPIGTEGHHVEGEGKHLAEATT